MAIKTDYDYGDDAKPKVTEDGMKRLAMLADRLRDEEVQLAELEKAKKECEQRIKELSEGHIPALMDELNTKEFVTGNGVRVSVESKLRVSVPKVRMPEAVKWFDEHGYDKLVDREFTIKFDREDEKFANKFAGDLKKRKRPLDSQVKLSVHPSRLAKWAREAVENGVVLPPIFNQFNQRFTKVVVEK